MDLFTHMRVLTLGRLFEKVWLKAEDTLYPSKIRKQQLVKDVARAMMIAWFINMIVMIMSTVAVRLLLAIATVMMRG